ncbi:hypothetical protein KY285_008246 [Solanum tuberosum]|nr:hypothetical protein KY285_008246 [Solanum tuberosum]
MRVYDPIPETLNALKDSNIQIMFCIPNDKLQALTDPKEAYNWVFANVINYIKQVRIRYISVGNEISPLIAGSSQFVPFLLPAMENVQRVITSFRLNHRVKISTVVETGLLANTYPPSQSTFREIGWPSEGGFGGSMGIATIYYRNLIGHAKSKAGTIHKPGKPIETYLFAMFDENLKIGAETEKHFGVFYPDKTQKYNLTF